MPSPNSIPPSRVTFISDHENPSRNMRNSIRSPSDTTAPVSPPSMWAFTTFASM